MRQDSSLPVYIDPFVYYPVTNPTSSEDKTDVVSSLSSFTSSKPGFFNSILSELRLVVWPSRQQILSESIIVMIIVGLSAIAIAAVDNFYGWTSQQIFL
uniref:Preprotein translocase subunit SecE n=1 Tax=Paulinella longichromatophora TaxID=1708747 RepID=A0A2H4ZPC6_9EUKA|nr:Preprotein translocase subunit SecE [Paulinella longichromatophora]